MRKIKKKVHAWVRKNKKFRDSKHSVSTVNFQKIFWELFGIFQLYRINSCYNAKLTAKCHLLCKHFSLYEATLSFWNVYLYSGRNLNFSWTISGVYNCLEWNVKIMWLYTFFEYKLFLKSCYFFQNRCIFLYFI